jgi:DNA polymerase
MPRVSKSGSATTSKNRLALWLRGERAFGLAAMLVGPPKALVAEHQMNQQAYRAPQTPPQSQQAKRAQTQEEVNEMPTTSRVDAPGPAADVAAAAAQVEPLFMEAPSFTTTSLLPREQKIIRLQQLDANEVKGCTRCRLHETRTNTVFGEGDADAQIFFIGEGPGESEDLSGRPFVGRAGQLLDRMIGGMGLKREQVYIANIVKCRPPGNRVPATDEVETCTPYLQRQLEIIRPKVIVTLGRPAATYMLQTKLSMGRLRGQWQNWRGIKLMPTFHPSYVLRTYTEEVRAAVWSDLKAVLVELGMPVPKKG